MSQRTKARTSILSSVALFLGLSLFLASCSTTKISSDYDPAVDFATLKSYAWMERPNPNEAPSIADNTLLRNRIERSVDAVLSAKGLSKVPRAEADFLISQHIGIQQKLQVDTTQYGYGYGFGYGAWGGPIGGYNSQTTVSQYDEGTLMLDFVNPESNNLIWRGTGQSRVRKTSNPQEREKLIRAVVDKILTQFPPAKK